MNALRPRSVGEILDRGLAVFLRTFWRAIRLLVPSIVVALVALIAVTWLPRSSRDAVSIAVIVVVPAFVLVAFCSVFYLYGSAASDVPCTVREAFVGGFRRAGTVFAYFLLLGCIGLLGVVPVFFAFYFIVNAFVKLASAGTAEYFVEYPIAVLGGLCAIACYGWYTTAASVGILACTFEGRGPLTSVRIAIARCTHGRRWIDAMLVGLAAAGAGLVVGIVVLPLGGFAAEMMPKNQIAIVAVSAIQIVLQAAAALLGYAWTAVFAIDARVRLEGLDLVAAAAETS